MCFCVDSDFSLHEVDQQNTMPIPNHRLYYFALRETVWPSTLQGSVSVSFPYSVASIWK